ncbi:MAG: META domain-containing protein, partial [Acidimicrobiia bacterium]|nr:META domain-containing protein [Acidimicrobiia bacterium]
LSGDPILLGEGPADPPLFEPAAQSDLQTIAHVALGTTQVAEIHVPGLVVIDLVGERVEDIELRRGTAQVWFGPDFVQVRWFPGGQDPCGSFTVTVAGGTEDGNRHAAVDLADRILLPAELAGGDGAADATDLLEGDWLLERSSVGGTPTEGGGLMFAFHGGDASWTDGCNTSTGRYEAVGEEAVRMDGVEGTRLPCPSNPTAQAVQQVMGAEQIQVSVGGDLLLLAVDDHRLTLRPG